VLDVFLLWLCEVQGLGCEAGFVFVEVGRGVVLLLPREVRLSAEFVVSLCGWARFEVFFDV